jgi:dolichol-phosphate mannosyltransferase
MTATLVVVPTYNEIDTLEQAVTRVRASVPEAHVLVVDDGSPDGTGELADKLASDDDHVHVLHRTAKLGLGAAYVAGFEWGLERWYDVLVEMDADGSHRPEELPRLLKALDGADLVIGSRYVPGGSVVNWPKRRELLSKAGNVYTRLALGAPLHDATGGFRAFWAGTLRKLALTDVESHGYCFQIDLAWRTLQAGLRVVEVPITFVEREHGESKMDGSIVREALWKVTAWGTKHRIGQVRAWAARRGARQAS